MVPGLICQTDSALGKPPVPKGCALQAGVSRTVASITDTRSVRLDDGSELFLKGLITPSLQDAGSEPGNWPPQQQSRALLETLLHGRSIVIAGTSKKRDRYGRLLAHVLVDLAGKRTWVQAELVRSGAARVDVSSLSFSCARALLAMERQAEQRKVGLWSHAAYRVRAAGKPRELLRYRSTFQIVEGVVHIVARVRKRIFINFDKNWRRDFTIGLSARMARRIAANGIDLDKLAGKRVRARGWIEWRGGPFIYLRSALQLRVLPEPARGTERVPSDYRRGRPDERSERSPRPKKTTPGGRATGRDQSLELSASRRFRLPGCSKPHCRRLLPQPSAALWHSWRVHR